MIQIIGNRGTGKSNQLMLLAKEKGAVYACENPYAMREKALAYGITGINFISYRDLLVDEDENVPVVIDELETFIKEFFGEGLIGYSLTQED